MQATQLSLKQAKVISTRDALKVFKAFKSESSDRFIILNQMVSRIAASDYYKDAGFKALSVADLDSAYAKYSAIRQTYTYDGITAARVEQSGSAPPQLIIPKRLYPSVGKMVGDSAKFVAEFVSGALAVVIGIVAGDGYILGGLAVGITAIVDSFSKFTGWGNAKQKNLSVLANAIETTLVNALNQIKYEKEAPKTD